VGFLRAYLLLHHSHRIQRRVPSFLILGEPRPQLIKLALDIGFELLALGESMVQSLDLDLQLLILCAQILVGRL
jgi:hypothetical protein